MRPPTPIARTRLRGPTETNGCAAPLAAAVRPTPLLEPDISSQVRRRWPTRRRSPPARRRASGTPRPFRRYRHRPVEAAGHVAQLDGVFGIDDRRPHQGLFDRTENLGAVARTYVPRRGRDNLIILDLVVFDDDPVRQRPAGGLGGAEAHALGVLDR